jgi:hypothetical protein
MRRTRSMSRGFGGGKARATIGTLRGSRGVKIVGNVSNWSGGSSGRKARGI